MAEGKIVIVPLFSVSIGILFRFGSVREVAGYPVKVTVTAPAGAEPATLKNTSPKPTTEPVPRDVEPDTALSEASSVVPGGDVPIEGPCAELPAKI